MALSQKHRGKILVPWFSSDEWRMVYNLIYAENSTRKDKENALSILRIWKARMPLLFAGLEGTLTILEVLLLDPTKLQETPLCSLYATAILRFLNICATNSDRQGTFYKTARKKNLPDWLINIRHDLAHSQKIPSKYMLTLSLKYCLNWLKSMYWDLQNDVIKDYIVKESDVKSNNEEVIKVFCDCTLASLNRKDAVELYIERIRELGIKMKKNTPFIVAQKSILNILVPKKLLSENNTIVDCIIENGSIFSFPTRTGKRKRIPKEYCKTWEVLWHYLEEQNLLMKLIEKFFDITDNKTINDNIKFTASLWLNEIFKGLLKKQMDYAKPENSTNYGDIKYPKAQSSQMKTPEISNNFNLAEYNPNLFSDLDKFKSNILQAPNEYVEVYLRNFLLVVGCPRNFISDMELAVNNFFEVDPDITMDEKLYTIEDVNKLFENVINEKENETEIMEINYTTNDNTYANSGKRWHQVEDTSLFDGYPLGVLPHQCRNINPIL